MPDIITTIMRSAYRDALLSKFMQFCEEEEVVFRGQVVTTPLCYETQRETISEVTAGFDDKLTAPPDPVLQTSFGVIIVSAGVSCLLQVKPPPRVFLTQTVVPSISISLSPSLNVFNALHSLQFPHSALEKGSEKTERRPKNVMDFDSILRPESTSRKKYQ